MTESDLLYSWCKQRRLDDIHRDRQGVQLSMLYSCTSSSTRVPIYPGTIARVFWYEYLVQYLVGALVLLYCQTRRLQKWECKKLFYDRQHSATARYCSWYQTVHRLLRAILVLVPQSSCVENSRDLCTTSTGSLRKAYYGTGRQKATSHVATFAIGCLCNCTADRIFFIG